MKRICACAVLLAICAAAPAVAQQPQKIIFDTDFAYPPQDDAMALFFVLNCPELQILGITTVAGNRSLNVATTDALKVLEVTQRTEIPVYVGAASPLMHKGTEWDTKRHGGWYANEPAPEPPGGFAEEEAGIEERYRLPRQHGHAEPRAGDHPGDRSARRTSPWRCVWSAKFAGNVKQLVIMGGAIASLPDGGGNHTPNAEFNFYVDPEAAQVVLRSGMPIVLSTLNISRKAKFTKEWYEKIVAVDTPITRLIKEQLGPRLPEETRPDGLMYDQIAAVTLIDPTLMKTVELYVDVDINQGANYGVSVGAPQPWPGGEGARKMMVQTDLDWEKFIRFTWSA